MSVQSGGIIGTAKQALGYCTPSEQQQTTATPGTSAGTQVIPSRMANLWKCAKMHAIEQQDRNQIVFVGRPVELAMLHAAAN